MYIVSESHVSYIVLHYPTEGPEINPLLFPALENERVLISVD